MARLQRLFPSTLIVRRETSPGQPYLTDEGNFILDLDFTPQGIPDPEGAATALKVLPMRLSLVSHLKWCRSPIWWNRGSQ